MVRTDEYVRRVYGEGILKPGGFAEGKSWREDSGPHHA